MWLQSPHSIIKSILSLPLERGWWVPHSQRYSRDAVTCLITGISWAALQHPAPQASPQNHSWISGESPSVCFRQALSKTWESCTERNLDPMSSQGPPLLCGLRFCVSIFRQFLPKPTSDFLAPSDGSRAPELSLEPALMPQRYVEPWEPGEESRGSHVCWVEGRGWKGEGLSFPALRCIHWFSPHQANSWEPVLAATSHCRGEVTPYQRAWMEGRRFPWTIFPTAFGGRKMAFWDRNRGDTVEKPCLLGTPAAPKWWECLLSLSAGFVPTTMLAPPCSLSGNPRESLLK